MSLYVAREEKTHVGEFKTLLLREDAEQVEELQHEKKMLKKNWRFNITELIFCYFFYRFHRSFIVHLHVLVVISRYLKLANVIIAGL